MEEIKEKLLEMQETILNDLESDRDKSKTAISGDIGDDIDHANEDRNRELYQLLCERDQVKLEQIHRALDAIETNTYGVCEDCGEKIGKKRLIALPFTKLCVDCKNEEERTKGISRATSDLSSSFSGSDTGEL
ncbi:MAG: TraR/DksA family transcriptional regulator [Proteobacteria bacterium]|nr:TraR/DksA family transcriptional regulator [Pseudomonadota bacterium]